MQIYSAAGSDAAVRPITMCTREDPFKASDPGPPATPAQLLCLARGFTLVFWGLALMLGLLLGQAVLEVCRGVRLPAYVLGVALTAWGAGRLRDAGPITPRWSRRTRMAQWLAWLAVYFAPFAVWWESMPQVTLFLVNVLALALTGMGLFLMVNLLAADVFGWFEHAGARVEALLYASGVAILMIAPFLVSLLFAFFGAVRYNAPFLEEVMRIARRVPPWSVVAATLPCSLSLVGVWKAKSICYERLWTESAAAEPAVRSPGGERGLEAPGTDVGE